MKSLIVSICILGMIGLVIGATSWAADTGTISATVTASHSAISITTDGTLTYGTLSTGTSTSTDPSGINEVQTFQNDGSTAQFNIKTSGATGGTAWTAAATAGSDQFVHSFTTTTSPTWQILNSQDTYETASSTVAASGTLDFYMKIDMPTASTDYVQKTITITVQAVAN